MADNVDVTPGTGATVATDDVGGVQYQRVKLDLGGNGLTVPVVDSLPTTEASAADILVAAEAIQAAVEALGGTVGGTELQVDVLTSALPTGAATAANQTTLIGHVDGVETLLTAIDGHVDGIEGSVDGLEALLTTLAGAVSGTEIQADVLTLPAIPAGTNNIGDVDVLTLPALPAGNNNIGDVDVASIAAGDNAIGRVKLTDGTDVADVLDLTNSNPLAVAITDGSGTQITSFGGGTQYTEADTDASITGTAMLWEDTSDTLRAVSAAKPLPVGDAGGSLTVDNGGTFAVQPGPVTSGGLLVYSATGADGAGGVLVATAQAVKASAGQVYGWWIYNPNTSVAFVHFYNVAAASVTVGTTNPQMSLTIPPLSAANLSGTHGIEFTNAGFAIAATTTAGGNTSPTTGLDVTVLYK